MAILLRIATFFALVLVKSSTAWADVGSLPWYVTSTPPLTNTELSVSQAYMALFGRAPDLVGLNYWTGELNRIYPSSQIDLAKATDLIISGVGGSLLMPADIHAAVPNEFVEYIYANVLGKSIEDDPEGQAYWRGKFANFSSRGALVMQMFKDANGTPAEGGGDMFDNKLLAVEAASRLQKARGRSLDFQDSQSLIRRIVGTAKSFNEAMEDMERLTNPMGANSPVISWDQSYTSTRIFSESITLSNSLVKNHKYLVWYNREGRMMLAHVFLPSNFSSGSNFPVVVSLHGGGWRSGFIEKLQRYNTELANAGYVVVAPGYRLTSFGYASPAQQNDVNDLISLLKKSASVSALKINANRMGFFGESAGGHLVNLIGSTRNLRCVSTLYPPSDLTLPVYQPIVYPSIPGTVIPGRGLDPYRNYYVGTSFSSQIAVSPTYVLSFTGTKFHIIHGLGDTLVDYRMSQNFKARADQLGVSVLLESFNGGHDGIYPRYTYPNLDLTTFNWAIGRIESFFNGCL